MLPGPQEWLVILLIILILFGASKLPEVARSLGRSVAEFRKAQRESEIELRELEKQLEKQQQIKREKIEKIARELGIDPTGKSDEELLNDINKLLREKKAS
ncbi:MAG: twin-arginine translocase TatA/TatE family subunit [Archaeoglobaceae archaeon]|nr:twin-arginine translocase TatA/TatE family subunit [Archaeoglobaceae archaeon]MCX8151660.1 twin-arginine translocase TatA/TatE family subunit [Archaeoglobaceae archaeon]MDW8013062.1 twin-arginine translocase TatA/TatE family subunit [Archaeoglobaceae archaeon]